VTTALSRMASSRPATSFAGRTRLADIAPSDVKHGDVEYGWVTPSDSQTLWACVGGESNPLK
jgi:hypothetical protein